MNPKGITPQLLKACLRNDRIAQRQLYEQYYSWGFNLCLRYAKNEVEAGEMLNDGFLRAFQGLKTFQSKGYFQSWLKRVLINAAINYLRGRKLHIIALEDTPLDQPTCSNQENLQYADVLAAIQRLPPVYRAVFNLYEMEGYSHQEIATLLKISASTSRSNLLRAKTKLQSMLLDYESTGKINYQP